MSELPLQLNAATGVPFYRQIVDQVAELIRSARLEPGSRLPSFRELAPQLRVSLITVRRAYADLEQAGLITRRQGNGTFVADGVETASKRHARAEARTQLATAVARARQLGLSEAELRVPFFVVSPGVAPGQRDDEAGTIDAHATALALAGLAPGPGAGRALCCSKARPASARPAWWRRCWRGRSDRAYTTPTPAATPPRASWPILQWYPCYRPARCRPSTTYG